jgi:hypothetical protein
VKKNIYYLFVLEGDIHPTIYGPYTNREKRNKEASIQKKLDAEKEDGHYWIDIDNNWKADTGFF